MVFPHLGEDLVCSLLSLHRISFTPLNDLFCCLLGIVHAKDVVSTRVLLGVLTEHLVKEIVVGSFLTCISTIVALKDFQLHVLNIVLGGTACSGSCFLLFRFRLLSIIVFVHQGLEVAVDVGHLNAHGLDSRHECH